LWGCQSPIFRKSNWWKEVGILRCEHSEGVLTIFLTGDIDAQNAAEIQQEIMELVELHRASKLVLDARNLA
jgi:anti-anti-sigma factor